jgi:hypothetical protein
MSIHMNFNSKLLNRLRLNFVLEPYITAHALGISFSTSRLLEIDLNTEISASNHYEVFLLFRLQPLWNIGTKNSSGLTPPTND